MSAKTMYLTVSGWKTKGRIVLDAIDIVCGQCTKAGQDRCEGLYDVCERCAVVEIADRMRRLED